jgi:galactose mutarotase-like enzyme
MGQSDAAAGATASEPTDFHRIVSEQLDVTVKALGAELASLRQREYGELLWAAEPIWPQHAPNLFPIVGEVAGHAIQVNGRSYPLERHGFARRRRFDWLAAGDSGCRLVLRDDDGTRAMFPFAFELEIGYEVSAATVQVTFVIRNPGPETLPASIGGHPAFRWPLADGCPKNAHTLEFERPEPAPIRRLQEGLLKPESFPTPVDGRVLRLDEHLFDADAIIIDRLASSFVRYSGPGTPAVVVAWRGFRELGIWSKPGAAFVCIEPWRGYASPVGFDGPFETKPGLLLIPAGGEEQLTIAFTIADSAPAYA